MIDEVQKVNSGRPQDEQQPFVNWLEVCRRRFPQAICNGSARYAICSHCGSQGGIVEHVSRATMVEDKETAQAMILGPCGSKQCVRLHEIVDLSTTPQYTSVVNEERRARLAAIATTVT
jgi:hypothetical protein